MQIRKVIHNFHTVFNRREGVFSRLLQNMEETYKPETGLLFYAKAAVYLT